MIIGVPHLISLAEIPSIPTGFIVLQFSGLSCTLGLIFFWLRIILFELNEMVLLPSAYGTSGRFICVYVVRI